MTVRTNSADLLNGGRIAETVRPLDYARRWWVPRHADNKPVGQDTITRWAREGVFGVTLPVVITSIGACTTEDACREFIRKVDAARRVQTGREETQAVPS